MQPSRWALSGSARSRTFALDAPMPGREELIGAPVRWPRSAAAGAARRSTARRWRRVCARSACTRSATCSSTCRATVARRARSPRCEPASRRRSPCRCAAICRARGQAPWHGARWSRRRLFDASGMMRATFFNQPWLVERYPPGTRLLLHGKADGRGGFGVSHHALASGRPDVASLPAAAGRADAGPRPLPRKRGRSPRRRSSRSCRAREALWPTLTRGPRRFHARIRERLPDRASALAAMHFPRAEGDLEAGRRRLAFDEPAAPLS